MKALTCSQCGGLIKGISMKKEIAVCDYCGAETLLKRFAEKVIEIPDQIADQIETQTDWEKYIKQREENRRRYALMAEPSVEVETGFSTYFFPVAIIVLIIGLPSILYYSFNQNQAVKDSDFKMSATVLYPDYLKAEKLSKPEITRRDVTDSQIEELKKLPLKEQTVIVKIEVDEKGFVVKADAEMQNEILRRSAEKSALETKFYPAGRKISDKMSYVFYEW